MIRGALVVVDFGDEIAGVRPAIIVQNDIANVRACDTIVVPLTTNTSRLDIPTHVLIDKGDGLVQSDSLAKCEQIQVIRKNQIKKFVGIVPAAKMEEIDHALCVALDLKGGEEHGNNSRE